MRDGWGGYPSGAPTVALAARRPVTLIRTMVRKSWIVQKGMRTRLSHEEVRAGVLGRRRHGDWGCGSREGEMRSVIRKLWVATC